MKNLKHPGIPIIYDTEEDENCYYLIEEYIQGESLSAFVQNQDNISQETVISIGVQLCDIVEYLHGQKPNPILYLDMKPEHIILCGKQLKLIDFGIATAAGEGGNSSQNCGTRGFAAPEQYSGKSCGTRTDIFGIGAILYYMLTGHILPQSTENNYPFPKHCSSFFKKIVLKAVYPEAELRYETALQLKTELQKLIPGQNKYRPDTHLLQKIIVTGSQKRIGSTHVAMGLVTWLNRQGRSALYEFMGEDPLSQLLSYKDGFVEENGIFRYRDFKGRKGTDFPRRTEEEHILVQDYGSDIMAVTEEESADLVILVMGSRSWEVYHSLKSYDRLSDEDNLQVFCNYGDSKMAKRYAEVFQRKVFSFPLDKDPFVVTKEKHQLFRQLFQEGGYRDKKKRHKGN